MDEIDIWRTASTLLLHHGEGTARYASRRLMEMTMEGDRESAEIWSALLGAIAVLSTTRPSGGQSRE